ncbi:formyltetrahydrofolate deformylase [Rhodovulum sp. DZ06]|uniref:formyltetrahydrofolate deformylase n=1 Tax=Rhodovulum sp. DZ06 TaxID=3425126 RepID=UPI003D329FDF
MTNPFVLTLSCEDRPGIVAAITTELAAMGSNITESNQFWDRESNRFFMRVAFDAPDGKEGNDIEKLMAPAFDRFSMKSRLQDMARKPKMILMVSKFDHALLHLLYQVRVGQLDAEVVAIVSNHPDAKKFADDEGVPYYHWAVTPETKAEQEAKLLSLVNETNADLVVLARYMQVLSDNLSNRLFGKVINIHHAFLPAFKGANPYRRAHERGVKLIGATAHYVTPDLDEGPIIEQEVERVTHAMSAKDLVAVGRDVENKALSRAVKLHLESRVMLNGMRTVVFA